MNSPFHFLLRRHRDKKERDPPQVQNRFFEVALRFLEIIDQKTDGPSPGPFLKRAPPPPELPRLTQVVMAQGAQFQGFRQPRPGGNLPIATDLEKPDFLERQEVLDFLQDPAFADSPLPANKSGGGRRVRRGGKKEILNSLLDLIQHSLPPLHQGAFDGDPGLELRLHLLVFSARRQIEKIYDQP